MANLNAVLNERVARIARKEIKSQTGATRKATIRYRKEIAALKRQLNDLRRTVSVLQRRTEQPMPSPVTAAVPEGSRFRADGLRTHRAKLGLSANDYGRLLGVSGLTVYSWESRKRKPRQAQLAKLIAVRAMGKREALKQLAESSDRQTQPSTRRVLKPKVSLNQDERFVLTLVRMGRARTGTAINLAWGQSGRTGTAGATLKQLLKRRQVVIARPDPAWGNQYRVA